MSIRRVRSPLAKILQDGLRKGLDETYFGQRKRFNQEDTKLLQLASDFEDDLKRIRKQFAIPKLDPTSDIQIRVIEQNGKDYEIEESKWLNKQTPRTGAELQGEIDKVIHKYNLPPNSVYRLEKAILYRQRFSIPEYHQELTNYVINNLNNIENIPLTTQEKANILDVFRLVVRNNSKVSKEAFKKAYGELRETLKKSKSRRRKHRTLETSLESLQIGKVEIQNDTYSLDEKQHKITSIDLAARLFRAYRVDTARRKAQMLRKQKQRLLHRISTRTKK